MVLHRSSVIPDWEKIPSGEWNEYQARAHETNGWDTPGNRETLMGAMATSLGLLAVRNEHNLVGLSLLAYGRWKDLRDGAIADATGTKSPKGEAIDAATDKVLMAMALPVLRSKKITTTAETAAMGLQAAANSAVSVLARLGDQKLAPSKLGKYSTFALWSAVSIGVVAENIDKTDSAYSGIKKIQRAAMATGLALGTVASLDYARQYLNSRSAGQGGEIAYSSIRHKPE